MRNPLILPLLAATLFGGIYIGTHVDDWSLFDSVHAKGYLDDDEIDSPLAHSGQALAKISAMTTPSVVHIQSERTDSRRGTYEEETGSGVLVNAPKSRGVVVVTNRHVVGDTELDQISIQLHDGRVVHPSRIWSDRATDLAVLQVRGKGLQTVAWGDSDQVKIGHFVLALGSPFGLSRSVTLGIISAKGRRSLRLGPGSQVLNQDFLQTDAAINPGNSGGPLLDMNGRLIGINTAIASKSGGNDGIGFSIPSNLVRRVVSQLIERGKVPRAYLGVRLDPAFDVEKATRLGLDRVRGARIEEVYPNSPASRANLKYDDVVLSFAGLDIQDENHLINLVSLTDIGKTVRLVILRSGKEMNVEVTLGDRTVLDGG